jgi:hypothetical protein
MANELSELKRMAAGQVSSRGPLIRFNSLNSLASCDGSFFVSFVSFVDKRSAPPASGEFILLTV